MIVLHYIPNLTRRMGQASRNVQQLHNILGTTMESHLVSGALFPQEFNALLKQINPDIVHIHGAWNHMLPVIQYLCISHGYPVIYSPHGALSLGIIHNHFWTYFVPRIIVYQFLITRKSFALVATSPEELKDLKELGWKKRIALITTPKNIAEHAVTATRYYELYKKVIDTVTRNRLSTIEKRCFYTLLYAAMANKQGVVPEIDQKIMESLVALNAHNWTSIQVYAIDHGVMDIMKQGAQVLQLIIPEVINTLPTRYSQKSLLKEYEQDKTQTDLNNKYSGHLSELALAQDIQRLNIIICKHHYSKEWPSAMALFVNIYTTIQWQHYDERQFAIILEDMNLKSFAASLMHVLSEYFPLTIGFMPVDPANNSLTTTIRKQLNDLT